MMTPNVQLQLAFLLLTVSGCYSLHLLQECLNVAQRGVGSPQCGVDLVESPERSKGVYLWEGTKVAGHTLWVGLEEGVHHRSQGLEEGGGEDGQYGGERWKERRGGGEEEE